MLPKLLTSIFGSRNDRLLKQYRQGVLKVNALEASFEQLSDTELRAKTDEFRSRVAGGETLDALLPEAFAAVREASKRTLKMRHFDVQLIGGMALHDGQDRRDAHRRGQDADGDAAGLPQRARRQGRPRRHRQRLPGAARRRVDGTALHVPRPHRRRQPAADVDRRRSRPPTAPTSPTARTTSSASTTCATTWCRTPPTGSPGA